MLLICGKQRGKNIFALLEKQGGGKKKQLLQLTGFPDEKAEARCASQVAGCLLFHAK